MKIIACLLKKSNGSISIEDIDINNVQKIRNIVSYLPQEFSFYPNMKVTEGMDYMALLSSISSRAERKERINKLLDKLNLNRFGNIKFKNLSGGSKRRLGIAISLLKDPKVLIVDEPTVGLDPEERVNFRNLIMEFAIERTVILSTHIVDDIEQTCQKIAILNEGKLVFTGEIQGLIKECIGKIKVIDIKSEDLMEIKHRYKVLSINESEGGYRVKIISDDNIGECITPTLEDSYLLKVKSK